MRLPNHENAQVPQDKVTGYLLSATHRDGRHKAAFFFRYGFSAANWEVLAEALQRHAADNEVARSEQTPFGRRYAVDGRLLTPNGSAVNVRVVWFVEEGESVPRLVTAYPLPMRQHPGQSDEVSEG
jgi:hypothetical protein